METGQTLQGKYVVDRLLGRGGMGTVYLAHDGDQPVAIKHLTLSARDDEERQRLLEMFRREAGILASLDHPSLVRAHEFIENGDECYLVMSYVEGRSLEQIYRESETFLDLDRVVRWMEEICGALAYLHEHDPPVIYRDLKPGNVMIDSTDHVVLLDFGIAKFVEGDAKTATIIRGAGTEGYAPIEQYGHGSTDARSDIYALGATFYTMVTHIQPPVSVDLLLADAALTPPSRVNPAVTPEMELVIFRLMSHRKEGRYQSANEARSALEFAIRKQREARDREIAREAPGAMKVRFVKPSALDSSGSSKSVRAQHPLPAPRPVQAEPARSGPRVRGNAPAPPLAGRKREAPAGPQQTELAPANMPVVNAEIPWWQGPYSAWHASLIVAVFCLLASIPSFFGQYSFAPVREFNAMLYSGGSAVYRGIGLLLQIAAPLGLAWLCYQHELYFWLLFFAYVMSQGISDMGLSPTGPSADLRSMMPPVANDVTTFDTSLHRVGLGLTAVSLLLMLRWLRDFRPRREKRVI